MLRFVPILLFPPRPPSPRALRQIYGSVSDKAGPCTRRDSRCDARRNGRGPWLRLRTTAGGRRTGRARPDRAMVRPELLPPECAGQVSLGSVVRNLLEGPRNASIWG